MRYDDPSGGPRGGWALGSGSPCCGSTSRFAPPGKSGMETRRDLARSSGPGIVASALRQSFLVVLMARACRSGSGLLGGCP